MQLWITSGSSATAEGYLWSATSVEMKRHAMVILLVTALGSRALGPNDHSTCNHVDVYTARTMLHVWQGARSASVWKLLTCTPSVTWTTALSPCTQMLFFNTSTKAFLNYPRNKAYLFDRPLLSSSNFWKQPPLSPLHHPSPPLRRQFMRVRVWVCRFPLFSQSLEITILLKNQTFFTNIDRLLLNACETSAFSYHSLHFDEKMIFHKNWPTHTEYIYNQYFFGRHDEE